MHRDASLPTLLTPLLPPDCRAVWLAGCNAETEARRRVIGGIVWDVGVEYVEVLSRTLAAPHRAAFAPHQLALAADVELQLRLLAPVLGVLDSVVLQLGGTTDAGRLAAACGGPSSGGSSSGGDESSSPASILWTTLYGALRLIDGPALEPAVERRLAAPSFGVRLLGQAAAAQRLLLASADQAAVDVRVAACAAAARLACRVAQQLLANHIARQQAAAEAPGACISDPQLMPAAAAMLQFVPAAAAAFRMAASEEAQQGGADPPEADTWGLCVWLAAAINLPLACEPAAVLSDCSSRLAAWCAAADAGLRLLPLLVRLQLGWQQRPSSGPPVPSEPGVPPPGALLARVLLKLWAVYLPPVSDALTIHTETSLGGGGNGPHDGAAAVPAPRHRVPPRALGGGAGCGGGGGGSRPRGLALAGLSRAHFLQGGV